MICPLKLHGEQTIIYCGIICVHLLTENDYRIYPIECPRGGRRIFKERQGVGGILTNKNKATATAVISRLRISNNGVIRRGYKAVVVRYPHLTLKKGSNFPSHIYFVHI